MTRDEILERLDYHGSYNKKVRKELNKLLKKYHPDNNKEDKTTILLLYEIKKQLEDGTLEVKDNNKNIDIDNDNSELHSFFLERIIQKLIIKKENINKKIENLYKKINKHIEERNIKQDKLSNAEFDVELLNNDLDNLLYIDIVDKMVIVFTILFTSAILVFHNYFFIIFIVICILIEIYYIYIRKKDIKNIRRQLEKQERKLRKVQNEFKYIDDNIQILRKDEIRLKKEKAEISNDIQFYSNELSKITNKEYENEYSKEKESGKSFRK